MQIELTLNVSDAHTINGLPDPISNCTNHPMSQTKFESKETIMSNKIVFSDYAHTFG